MAKAFIDDTNLTNIANAIRNHNGLTTTYYPSEMANAIAELPVLDTSDGTASASDIVINKTAYVNGKKVTGSVNTIGSMTKAAKTVTYNNDDSRLELGFSGLEKSFVNSSSQFTTYCTGSSLGNATAEDVAEGKTFTSTSGLKVTGTYNITNDSYIWKKYESDPSVPIETQKTDVKFVTHISSLGFFEVQYSDSIDISNDAISLVDAKSVKSTSISSYNVIKGKYIRANTSTDTSSHYYIPSDATVSTNSVGDGVVSSAVSLKARRILNYVTSKSSDTYPTNGEHTDGYWYVYKGLMSDIMSGAGETTTPTLQTKTVTPSESSQSVTPDSGYDGLSKVTVNAISSTYVGSGVTQKSAATYTPSTSNQTIASGTYLSGTQTIKGDSNLVAGNIKSGVSIFGVSGSYTASSSGTDTSDATASASDILSGKTAYVKGSKITGTIASQAAQTITPGTSDKTIASGKYLSGTQTIKGDSNLVAGNIKSGVSIFGVTGSYTGSGSSSSGTTMKSGTTTSATIDTGLSSISAIVIYKDSLTATGLIQGVYSTSDSTLHYTYCSYYSTYSKMCSTGTSTASSVSGGTFTLGTSGTSGLSSSTTYNWIAFGAA